MLIEDVDPQKNRHHKQNIKVVLYWTFRKVNGLFTQKLSSFTHPHVVPNL